MNKDAYQIRKMNDAEFTFMLSGEPNTKYIEGIMEAESISYEQAKAKADKQVNEQLLPEGIKTKDNEFYSLIYKDEFIGLLWLKFDKKDHAKWVKDNMKPFEELFFEVGAEIMKNVSGWLAASPDSTVQRVKKQLDSAISNVKSGGDLKKLNTLKLQLDKLNKIGGLDAIVPSEGIVFKYNGKTYKFTGAFAPINQITGLMTF